jgi:hypothetical protein
MKLFFMSIKTKLTVILSQVFFVLTVSSSCLAYFDAEPVKQSIKTITSPLSTLPPSASYYFVWSDNYELHNHFASSIIDDSPQALRKFIFAFYVPIIETLTQQQEHYVPSEFSFENLLYANLKYAQLTNEYNGYKERSVSVLEGLDVPYTKWTPSLESGLVNKDYTSTNKIDRVYNHQKPKQSATKTPLYNIQPPINFSSRSTLSRPSFYQNQDIRNPRSVTGSSASGDNGQDYDADYQLPFVLRTLVSSFNYSVENKLEVFIYCCILFGFFRLLWWKRR